MIRAKKKTSPRGITMINLIAQWPTTSQGSKSDGITTITVVVTTRRLLMHSVHDGEGTSGESLIYMTTHQQDSSQPQQSQDSPQLTGFGLTMEVTEEIVEPGMMMEDFTVPHFPYNPVIRDSYLCSIVIPLFVSTLSFVQVIGPACSNPKTLHLPTFLTLIGCLAPRTASSATPSALLPEMQYPSNFNSTKDRRLSHLSLFQPTPTLSIGVFGRRLRQADDSCGSDMHAYQDSYMTLSLTKLPWRLNAARLQGLSSYKPL
ncbi:hypothetical protein K504DRAFT_529707 [Pleomassaria siparia CBS 279.74]|uniref:Uncharacterized protein n=1 Tax=Pleomassaria siparia CBS 279.74 TaxID=1314801 RepID=A0A6G1KT32_9PLEO|nr:hypothetical protein K504DRAFT_529707 [Pleomassaria siparia CBS 279.74]